MQQSSPKRDQSSEVIHVQAVLPYRDALSLKLTVNKGEILSAELNGVGCSALLNLVADWRSRLTGQLKNLNPPQGTEHFAILMRELILRAKGEWHPPYAEDEICHCRVVPTSTVEAAIVGGCHTVRQVARETSAGTSCGACRMDVEALIAYRLGQSGS